MNGKANGSWKLINLRWNRMKGLGGIMKINEDIKKALPMKKKRKRKVIRRCHMMVGIT